MRVEGKVRKIEGKVLDFTGEIFVRMSIAVKSVVRVGLGMLETAWNEKSQALCSEEVYY